MDEADIRDKYKNKPDQAQAIIERAMSFKHPTRKYMLYEDVSFKTLEASNAE